MWKSERVAGRKSKKWHVFENRELTKKSHTEINGLHPSQAYYTFHIAFVLRDGETISPFEEIPFQFLAGVVLDPCCAWARLWIDAI